MGQMLDLGLELQNAFVIGMIEGADEITDLLHLQPEIGAEHDHRIQTRTHHSAVCADQGVSARLIEFGENPGEIAGRVIDLHILPVVNGCEAGVREQEVAVIEAAVHRACGEGPQTRGVDDIRPATDDLLGNMAGLAQSGNPGQQLLFDVVGGEAGVGLVTQEGPAQSMDGAYCGSDRHTILCIERAQGH